MDGDVDAAIEFLVSEQGTEEYTAANDSLTRHVDGSYGNGQSIHVYILDILVRIHLTLMFSFLLYNGIPSFCNILCRYFRLVRQIWMRLERSLLDEI